MWIHGKVAQVDGARLIVITSNRGRPYPARKQFAILFGAIASLLFFFQARQNRRMPRSELFLFVPLITLVVFQIAVGETWSDDSGSAANISNITWSNVTTENVTVLVVPGGAVSQLASRIKLLPCCTILKQCIAPMYTCSPPLLKVHMHLFFLV